MRAECQHNRVVTFLESTMDLKLNLIGWTRICLGRSSDDHTGSRITVYQDSITTEVPYPNRDDKQNRIMNRLNNHSPPPSTPKRYVHPSDIPHARGITVANQPEWCIGKHLICCHCYAPVIFSPYCTLNRSKVQTVVARFEKSTSYEKAHVPDKNYEFSKQLVPERPQYLLANAIENGHPKDWSGASRTDMIME